MKKVAFIIGAGQGPGKAVADEINYSGGHALAIKVTSPAVTRFFSG